jgi:type I restriction enzyme M protein
MVISDNTTVKKNGNGAGLGFEEKLWLAADKMRGHIEASEYKHVFLGLIFLKYLSDVFQERYRWLEEQSATNPENRDEYAVHGTFWIPEKARWSYLISSAKDAQLPQLIDEAMVGIEEVNPELEGALPKHYARLSLHNYRLSELLLLIDTIGLGDEASRSKDVLGRVYEYFLGRFAYAEGKGGEFYTPPSVVRLLVELIEPYKGSVYDPCCGSGGMFVQSEKFVLAHGGKISDLSIYGQELNPTTWRLCKMNLAIRGIQGDIGVQPADSFHNDLHAQHKADFILANPPFNISDWGGERLRHDPRWRYGIPSSSNANFAWIQHMVHHLAPTGSAAFVLTNGSLSANQERQEGSIRQALIQADLVDCIIALPPNLFYNTQIATCIWILTKDKQSARFRDRRGSTLFIYAQHLGQMVDRVHRELRAEDICMIANAYHTWRDRDSQDLYHDAPGFSKSTTLEEIRSHKWSLVPGRYVGFDESLSQQWDSDYLHRELEQVEARLAAISEASIPAMSVLKELIHG